MTSEERAYQRTLLKEHRGTHRALFKIMDQYASAPGMASPEPTPKLVWSMYQTALKAAKDILQR